MALVRPPPARAVPVRGNSEPLFYVVLHAQCRSRYRLVLRDLAAAIAIKPSHHDTAHRLQASDDFMVRGRRQPIRSGGGSPRVGTLKQFPQSHPDPGTRAEEF